MSPGDIARARLEDNDTPSYRKSLEELTERTPLEICPTVPADWGTNLPLAYSRLALQHLQGLGVFWVGRWKIH